MVDTGKSLEQLENDAWGEPDYDSHLVKTVHWLRQKPLKEFSVEDLRIMIGQQIGLRFLIPLAIKILQDTPLAEGDFYPGDLFCSVLGVSSHFWNDHPDLRAKLEKIVPLSQPLISQLDQSSQRVIRDAISRFRTEGSNALPAAWGG